MLKAEREDGDLQELLVGELRESAAKARAEFFGGQRGGVDDEVGRVAHGAQLAALARDGRDKRLAGLCERVAAAVLVIAADEDLVGGVEKHDLAADLVLAQLLQGVRDLVKEALAPEVAGHGEVAPHAGVDAHELGELEQKPRRQVVDAEVAHVLEHMERLCASRARHTGDDHDVGHAVAALRRAHLLAADRHGSFFPALLSTRV